MSISSPLLPSPSDIAPGAARQSILSALIDVRDHTLHLTASLPPYLLTQQAHPAFSPIGWHLGHIAYTESLWIAEGIGQQLPTFPEFAQLFAADGLPKSARQNLPPLTQLHTYLKIVRSHTHHFLTETTALSHNRLWRWLIQHESQHLETMLMVLAMHSQRDDDAAERLTSLASWPWKKRAHASRDVLSAPLTIEAGEFSLGSNRPDAIDNEQPQHAVWLDAFEIDAAPVTVAEFSMFIDVDGYQTRRWWSEAGWQWQTQQQLSEPFYWHIIRHQPHLPVCGVSWYEADAYARFAQKRLPTEAEWEKSAIAYPSAFNRVGVVWEWTDSWFSPYPGFRPFPYEGYSQAYFDGEHRVLRGHSWASPPPIQRYRFRNWYHPYRRELFSGFRCAV